MEFFLNLKIDLFFIVFLYESVLFFTSGSIYLAVSKVSVIIEKGLKGTVVNCTVQSKLRLQSLKIIFIQFVV